MTELSDRTPSNPGRIAGADLDFALILSGGNALGAYQGGAYEALHEADWLPQCIAGASAGAINGAVICGNAVIDGKTGEMLGVEADGQGIDQGRLLEADVIGKAIDMACRRHQEPSVGPGDGLRPAR